MHLFRPEEMDAASGKGPVLGPVLDGDIDVADNSVGRSAFDHAVPDDHVYVFIAVKTKRFDFDSFTREYPADRQGFKASLREPFLLAIDRNTVMRGHIVERGKGFDELGPVRKPHRHSEAHELMKELFPFVRSHTEFFRDFGVMRPQTALHKCFQDEMIRPVELLLIRHDFSFIKGQSLFPTPLFN